MTSALNIAIGAAMAMATLPISSGTDARSYGCGTARTPDRASSATIVYRDEQPGMPKIGERPRITSGGKLWVVTCSNDINCQDRISYPADARLALSFAGQELRIFSDRPGSAQERVEDGRPTLTTQVRKTADIDKANADLRFDARRCAIAGIAR